LSSINRIFCIGLCLSRGRVGTAGLSMCSTFVARAA
jgi:hypothetical protein